MTSLLIYCRRPFGRMRGGHHLFQHQQEVPFMFDPMFRELYDRINDVMKDLRETKQMLREIKRRTSHMEPIKCMAIQITKRTSDILQALEDNATFARFQERVENGKLRSEIHSVKGLLNDVTDSKYEAVKKVKNKGKKNKPAATATAPATMTSGLYLTGDQKVMLGKLGISRRPEPMTSRVPLRSQVSPTPTSFEIERMRSSKVGPVKQEKEDMKKDREEFLEWQKFKEMKRQEDERERIMPEETQAEEQDPEDYVTLKAEEQEDGEFESETEIQH